MECPKNDRFSAAELASPADFFYPCYAWVWNEQPELTAIRETLDGMVRLGIRSIYILPMSPKFRPDSLPSSMTVPYLSEEYIRLLHETAKEAARRGITVWFYDEDGWPSGYAGGRTVAACPEAEQKRLTSRTVTLPAGETLPPSPEILAAFVGTGRVPLPFTAETDTALTVYAADTRRTYPEKYPDLCDPRATAAFIAETHERVLTDGAEGKFPLVFTDEPHLDPRPWTPGIAEAFREKFGYDILDFLPALTDAEVMGEAGQRARVDFCDFLYTRFADNYYGKLRDWCHAHGRLLTGHADKDDDISQWDHHGHLLRDLRRLDIPGVDAIWRQIYPAAPRRYTAENNAQDTAQNRFFPRIASSAAHQNGGRYALTESFSVYGAGTTFADMRYVLHFQALRGINMYNLMTVNTAKDAEKLTGIRPLLVEEMPAAPAMSAFNTAAARLSYLSSLGRPDIRVGLLYPIRDLWAGGAAAAEADARFRAFGEALERQGVEFDIVDEDIILAAPEGGVLPAGTVELTTLLIPAERFLSPAAGGKLARMQTAGLRVCRDVPALAPPWMVSPADAPIRGMKRVAENGTLYYFCNEGFAPVTATVSLPETGQMLELDVRTGCAKRRVGRVTADAVTVRWESGEGRGYFFPNEPTEAAPPEILPERALELKSFTVCPTRRTRLGAAGLYTEIPDGPPVPVHLSGQPDAPEAGFSGELTYRTAFDLPAPAPLVLDLGQVAYAATVELNGQPVGTLCAPPYRLTVPAGFVREHNELTVRVMNTLANELLTSPVMAAAEFAKRSPYHALQCLFERERTRAGLFGPVTVYY